MTGDGCFRGDDSPSSGSAEAKWALLMMTLQGLLLIELTIPIPISLTAFVRLVSVVPISLEGESCCFPPFSAPLNPESLVSRNVSFWVVLGTESSPFCSSSRWEGFLKLHNLVHFIPHFHHAKSDICLQLKQFPEYFGLAPLPTNLWASKKSICGNCQLYSLAA
jgi:hypothetical protein